MGAHNINCGDMKAYEDNFVQHVFFVSQLHFLSVSVLDVLFILK